MRIAHTCSCGAKAVWEDDMVCPACRSVPAAEWLALHAPCRAMRTPSRESVTAEPVTRPASVSFAIDLLQEIGSSGVEHAASRYITVQLDPDTLRDAVAAAAALDADFPLLAKPHDPL